jgi:biopolymer transport protein ExbD
MPEVNMIPMMGVMLVVLAFFVFVSMTLRNQEGADVPLPALAEGGTPIKSSRPFIVALNEQGQILVDGQPLTETQLADRMVAFLNENPEGSILLKASRDLPYEKVVTLLQTMRDVGGPSVALAVEQS